MTTTGIQYTEAAERALDRLREHYRDRGRIEALLNLADAQEEAEARIKADPAAGAVAPRMYPRLERPNRAWIEQGGYWFNYSLTDPPVVLGVYYAPVIEGTSALRPSRLPARLPTAASGKRMREGQLAAGPIMYDNVLYHM